MYCRVTFLCRYMFSLGLSSRTLFFYAKNKKLCRDPCAYSTVEQCIIWKIPHNFPDKQRKKEQYPFISLSSSVSIIETHLMDQLSIRLKFTVCDCQIIILVFLLPKYSIVFIYRPVRSKYQMQYYFLISRLDYQVLVFLYLPISKEQVLVFIFFPFPGCDVRRQGGEYQQIPQRG